MEILSLGAGVQSSTVFLMSCNGVLPKLDAAIFADTQWEPVEVYNYLGYLESQGKKAGIPVYRVSKGNLREDALRSSMQVDDEDRERWVSVQFYTYLHEKGVKGQLSRQCTKEYKILPINKKIS